MDGIHVVAGDLETLSVRVAEVAETVSGLDLRSPLVHARSAMPGADARSTMEATGDALEDRATARARSLSEHSDSVSAAAASFARTDSDLEASLQAAGTATAAPSPTGHGAAARLSARME